GAEAATAQRSSADVRAQRPESDRQTARETGGDTSRSAASDVASRANDPTRGGADAARIAGAESTPTVAATPSKTSANGSAAGQAPAGTLAAGAGGAAAGTAPVDGDRDALGNAEARVTIQRPASIAAARAGAEAALARDVIPPDYRDHVRAYF